jgi:hypothetical protein
VIAAEAGSAAPETDTATDTATATEGETPTVDRDAPDIETGDAALADPAGMAGLGALSLRPTLALYNASICGQPLGAAPTPTVAAVAGATELEEPVAGVEAVNALAASLAAFPGIVKLEPRRADETGLIASGHCSAVRIRANWFVTAAHCVDQPYDEIRMIGDSANLRSPAARITAAETALCHGGYLGTDNGYSNDIALLRLSPEQASLITAVPVARSGATRLALAPANYPTGEIAGWGLSRLGGQLSYDLGFAGPTVLFSWPSRGGLTDYTVDEQAKAQAESMDGKLLLVTNVADLKPQEVVNRYKALADIERGFRVLKSEIDIAPVYHRLPQRIRAHAMLCFLALILHRVMRQRLQLAKSELSSDQALAQLRRIQRHSVSINRAAPVTGVSTINTQQARVLAALNVKKPAVDAQMSLL